MLPSRLIEDFWATWPTFYGRLRPAQAERLLVNFPLLKATAWGQVDLDPVFRLDFSQALQLDLPAGGDELKVRQFAAQVRRLVSQLQKHPRFLQHLPALTRIMTLVADYELAPQPVLASSLASPLPVPLSNLELAPLLAACGFTQVGLAAWTRRWWPFRVPMSSWTLPAQAVSSPYDHPTLVAAQVEDMDLMLADWRVLLHFARHWRDLGDQELWFWARGQDLEALPVYHYYAGGRTEFQFVMAEKLPWGNPSLRLLAVPKEYIQL